MSPPRGNVIRSLVLLAVLAAGACGPKEMVRAPAGMGVTEPERARAVTYATRGEASRRAGRLDLAIEQLSRAIELNPTYPEAYHYRALAYRDQRDYEKAILDHTKAIELKPDYADAYQNRATAYYYQGEYVRAWADVKKCRQLGGQVNERFFENLWDSTLARDRPSKDELDKLGLEPPKGGR